METVVYNILVHSIGQGLLLAAAVSLLQLVTSRVSASLRYRLLTGCLLLFVIETGIYSVSEIINLLNGNTKAIIVPFLQSVHSGFRIPVPLQLWNSLAQLTAVASDHSHTICLVWLVLVLLKCVQVSLGIARVYELKTNHQYNAAANIQHLVRTICHSMGITRQVRLAISTAARVPMVIGHFKPLILLPVGLLNNLTMEETEAVLLHELAHIRRNDFLVNILQHITEIIFFYHPVIWWVNRLIRKEREHCCDDEVVAGNKVPAHIYAKALVGCLELRQNDTYILAMSGGSGQLQQRVLRIINNRYIIHDFKALSTGFIALTLLALTWCFATPDGEGKITVTHTTISRSGFVKEEQEEIYQQPAAATFTAPSSHTSISYPAQQKMAQAATAADSISMVAVALQKKASADSAMHPPYITDEEVAYLKQELQHDGLINLDQNTSYMLNQDELIVNGCRQPAAIHRRYAEKYIKHPGVAILYNYHYSHTICG